MTTPRQPSGGASSISYRKRRTRTPQPPMPSQQPGALARRHSTSSGPCRARHRLPRSAPAAETLLPTHQDAREVVGDLVPNPDQYPPALRAGPLHVSYLWAPLLHVGSPRGDALGEEEEEEEEVDSQRSEVPEMLISQVELPVWTRCRRPAATATSSACRPGRVAASWRSRSGYQCCCSLPARWSRVCVLLRHHRSRRPLC
jgi:hypothetical protein